jgi:predicted RNA binding protein YcfA (HicA-like mRNA interferase family)
MKRVDLIRHLERCGCEFFRQGGDHTVYINRSAGKSSSIPRHREMNDFLARKICVDLQRMFTLSGHALPGAKWLLVQGLFAVTAASGA